MADAIFVRPNVVVPAHAIVVRAVRSSGPGGQNVNKVASKIELHVDLGQIVGLDHGAARRLFMACANRLDSAGHLLVTSQKTRDQHRNLMDARERVREIIAAAMVRPRKRTPTTPTRASVDRRIRRKKQRSRLKQSRRDRGDDD